MVAALVDQLFRRRQICRRRLPRIRLIFSTPHSAFRIPHSEESCAVKVNVRLEQAHPTARSDVPGFVQVALGAVGASLFFGARAAQMPQSGAGEQVTWEFVLRASAAEDGHLGFDGG